MVGSLPGGVNDTSPGAASEPNPLGEMFDLVEALVGLYEIKPTATLTKKIPPEIASLKTMARNRGLGGNIATAVAIDALQARFDAAKREANKKNYPIKDKFYSHSGKEDGMDDAEKLGFSRGSNEYETYCRTGYEIEFDVLVQADGTVLATHVNGTALTEPVEI